MVVIPAKLVLGYDRGAGIQTIPQSMIKMMSMKKIVVFMVVASGLLFFLVGCPKSKPHVPQNQNIAGVTMSVDSTRLEAVKPLILGTNTQWVDLGDGIVNDNLTFNATTMKEIQAQAPTLIRYPGGTLSDGYLWLNGMGPLKDRVAIERYPSNPVIMEKISFGTKEFLELCKTLNAEPLITVNTSASNSGGDPVKVEVNAMAKAADAAAWVQRTNKTGITSSDGINLLPKVTYWEIGNEPYLIADDKRPELSPKPDEYVIIANAVIPAMKAVDFTIQVGLPLRSDTMNSVPVTPFPGYNDTVLKGVTDTFDYVSVHNAYLPVIFNNADTFTDEQLYYATMASLRVFLQDLDATRTQLASHSRSGKQIALTEYNTFFTIGGNYDARIDSFTTALYVADLLAVLFEQPDIIFANHWSLIGNWHFGSINSSGQIKPSGLVLSQFKNFLKGHRLATATQGPTFSNSAVGIVPSYNDNPVVKAVASTEGNVMRMWVINKSSQPLKLNTQTTQNIRAARADDLSSAEVWSNKALTWKKTVVTLRDSALSIELKPHSVTFVELDI